MGWGDELMASGQARGIHARTGRRVQIIDRHRVARWNVLWDGLDYIARPSERGQFEYLLNSSGERPYHLGKQRERWIFNPSFRAEPAQIAFNAEELEFAGYYRPQIVVEPNLKPRAIVNKDWGWERWEAFAELARAAGLELVQLGPSGTRQLQGVALIETRDFRHGCAVLARAQAFVGHEGGLHHAAAALGVPGVVIFGGFTPVELTGYAIHRNLGVGMREACGMRLPCKHCAREMAAIAPARVLEELEVTLEERRRSLAA